MSTQITLKNCDLATFRQQFKTRQEYLRFIGEMTLKERLTSWKPSNELEANLQQHLSQQALVKVGSGAMKTTSYLVDDRPESVTVWISYGGRRQRLTRPGWHYDVGGYVTATPNGSDLTLTAQTAYEFHRVRYILLAAAGLLFFVVPGVSVVLDCVVMHWLNQRKLRRYILPSLIRTFEGRSSAPPE
jgi:hypothetical protein